MEKPDYRVYKNVLRMLRDRGWKNVCKTMSAKDYEETPEPNPIPLVFCDSRVLRVFFVNAPVMKKSHLDSSLRTMKNEEATHALFVYKGSITPATGKYISESDNMDSVNYQSLYRCCLDHMFVPDYELLSESDRIELPYKDDDLPMMKISDPIARWYDASPGDIFRIMRKNPQSGHDVFYRIVVS